MPPKCKFTKEVIIKAALNMARENGLECITSRSLGKRLGSSVKPVFSVFKNMDELLAETVKAIRNEYNQCIEIGLSTELPFKGVGIQYIMFAVNEPEFFKILFMRDLDGKTDALNVLPVIDENYNEILLSVQKQYSFSETEAKIMYKHLWIYTHGIASLIATNMCSFSEEEISSMLTEVCTSLIKKIKGDRAE